jgi:hypothetical protein
LVFRAFLIIAFSITVLYISYGKERERQVQIVRNVAWNDLVRQINPVTDDSSGRSFQNEMVLIQKFLTEHQSEVTVGIYDIAVFRAIDQLRCRLQKADKDLETIRNELSYKEDQSRGGR